MKSTVYKIQKHFIVIPQQNMLIKTSTALRTNEAQEFALYASSPFAYGRSGKANNIF